MAEYLEEMEAANRAPNTIRTYRIIFESFARFLGVPVAEVHDHLSPDNLIKYAGTLKNLSGETATIRLSVLRAYFVENGVAFNKMKMKVLTAKRRTDPDDKPLEIETIRKMMDVTDARGRAFITFMVSTGMRPGEAAQLQLSDLGLERVEPDGHFRTLPIERGGDTVVIRNTISKGGRGGVAYLTEEAREYLDIWLKARDEFMRQADIHSEVFAQRGRSGHRPKKDERLFASSYAALNAMFRRLYKQVDGERGRYRHRITPHSMRKYFRTQATQGGLHIDIVDKIMRHTGAYLAGSYFRLTEEEIRRKFHEHKAALYITRKDQRIQDGELGRLRDEIRRRDERDKIIEGELAAQKKDQAAMRVMIEEMKRGKELTSKLDQ